MAGGCRLSVTGGKASAVALQGSASPFALAAMADVMARLGKVSETWATDFHRWAQMKTVSSIFVFSAFFCGHSM
jgi:hypothetical protein